MKIGKMLMAEILHKNGKALYFRQALVVKYFKYQPAPIT